MRSFDRLASLLTGVALGTVAAYVGALACAAVLYLLLR
jgi:hypothetical protein